MTAPHVSGLKISVSVAFVASALALAASSVYVLRLRCEGFGCMGVGIAWAAWAAGYLTVVALGAALRSVLPEATRIRRVITWGLLMLMALGAGLVLYWLVRRAT